ncbi:MAG TPA: hypothetical protein VEQ59_09805, partial [Polyangiaceae bacterium]|nr:hypothetical protein [Polyangiaceae bacterium]
MVELLVLLENDGTSDQEAGGRRPLCRAQLLGNRRLEQVDFAHFAQALLEPQGLVSRARGRLQRRFEQLPPLLLVPARLGNALQLEENDAFGDGLLTLAGRAAATDHERQRSIGLFGPVELTALPRKLRQEHQDARIHTLDLGGFFRLGERLIQASVGARDPRQQLVDGRPFLGATASELFQKSSQNLA